MIRTLFFLTSIVFAVITPATLAQVKNYKPVTDQMLLNPSPDDWLMFSRTYDSQRFSPLKQINRQNAGQLRTAWVRGMDPGIHENIPIVHDGVMYVVNPNSVIQALDATNGDLLWEYRRRLPNDLGEYINSAGRNRAVSIYDDLVFFAAPDGYIVALDAVTGKLRWETQAHDYQTYTQHTAGAIVIDGKVLSGRGCSDFKAGRQGCFIVAHDARTGKELWKFYTAAGDDDPGGKTWGSVPEDRRMTSPWGLPGSFDPVRKLTFWGVANPRPHTRMKRHGSVDDIPRVAPADLYSDSTVALDISTGKLAWYYQHLPGDDWDSDFTNERVLLRTRLNPDPKEVKWISSKLPRGQERDVVVGVGEPGGIWVLDRGTGEFLWTAAFPFDSPNFVVSRIDTETGKTYINWDLVLKKDGDKALICFINTKSYWPMAYHPGNNSLYAPYNAYCSEKTADNKAEEGASGTTLAFAGVDAKALTGIAKVNMSTGQLQHWYTQRMPGNGGILATAGDLIFWGDMDRRFRAFDADSGKVLWETIVGGIVQMSTITYAVNGKQYVAVLTGDGASGTTGPLSVVRELKPPRRHNAIYVFALP